MDILDVIDDLRGKIYVLEKQLRTESNQRTIDYMNGQIKAYEETIEILEDIA